MYYGLSVRRKLQKLVLAGVLAGGIWNPVVTAVFAQQPAAPPRLFPLPAESNSVRPLGTTPGGNSQGLAPVQYTEQTQYVDPVKKPNVLERMFRGIRRENIPQGPPQDPGMNYPKGPSARSGNATTNNSNGGSDQLVPPGWTPGAVTPPAANPQLTPPGGGDLLVPPGGNNDLKNFLGVPSTTQTPSNAGLLTPPALNGNPVAPPAGELTLTPPQVNSPVLSPSTVGSDPGLLTPPATSSTLTVPVITPAPYNGTAAPLLTPPATLTPTLPSTTTPTLTPLAAPGLLPMAPTPTGNENLLTAPPVLTPPTASPPSLTLEAPPLNSPAPQLTAPAVLTPALPLTAPTLAPTPGLTLPTPTLNEAALTPPTSPVTTEPVLTSSSDPATSSPAAEPATTTTAATDATAITQPYSGLKLEQEMFQQPLPAPTAATEQASSPAAQTDTTENLPQETPTTELTTTETPVSELPIERPTLPPLDSPALPSPAATTESTTPQFVSPAPAPNTLETGEGLPRTASRVPEPLSTPPMARVESPKPKQSPEQEAKMTLIRTRSSQSGLKGFCPVVLRDERDLRDAEEQFSALFNGRLYSFSSEPALEAFLADPARYAPAAGGNDVIHKALTGEELEGSLDHAVWYQGRLYLFTSVETLETFTAAPSSHATAE